MSRVPHRRPAIRGLELSLCVALSMSMASAARADQPVPRELQGIQIDGRLGADVPLDVPFVDQNGAQVKLRDYVKAGHPTILTLNYYSCATLCSFILNAFLSGIRGVDFTIGKEFQVVTLSIDPKEGPALAAAKRKTYLTGLGKPVADGGWAFLTGREADIKKVADAVGFHYRYDAPTQQFAHAAGIFVLTPEGKLSRILYGIDFPARDLRLALVEASKGGISSPIDRILLLCYHYDPDARRYGITPMAIMRIGGVLTMVILGAFLLVMWRRERRVSVVHD